MQTIDATTESHIYQIKLTEALVSQLSFQKGKDAEVAWIDAQIVTRNQQIDATGESNAMDVEIEFPSEEIKILALEPMKPEDIPSHESVFINELKLSDFKQILMKNNIPSEFSGGVLWCCNGALALKRVRINREKKTKMFAIEIISSV